MNMKRLLLAVLTLLMLLGIIPALAEESSALSWVEDMGLETEYKLTSNGELKLENLNLPEDFSSSDYSISLYKTVADGEDVLVTKDVSYAAADGGYLMVGSLSGLEDFEDGAAYYLLFKLGDESKASNEFGLHLYPYIKLLRNGKNVSGKQIKLKDSDTLSVDMSYISNSPYYSKYYEDYEICWLIKVEDWRYDNYQPNVYVGDTINKTMIEGRLATVDHKEDDKITIYVILKEKSYTGSGYESVWITYGGDMNEHVNINVPMLTINIGNEDITNQTLTLKSDTVLTVDREDFDKDEGKQDYAIYWLIQRKGVSETNQPDAIQSDTLSYEQIKAACSGTSANSLEGIQTYADDGGNDLDGATVYAILAPADAEDTSYASMKSAYSEYTEVTSITLHVEAEPKCTVTYRLIDDKSEYDVVKIYDKGSSITLPGYHNAEELGELNSALTNAKHAEDAEDSNEYYITRWYDPVNYDELPLGATLTLNDNLVLEARSTQKYNDTKAYTITFKPGSYHGTAVAGSEYALSDVYFGSQLAAPDPADLGCTAPGEGVEFLGWVEDGDSNGNPVKAGESVSVYSSRDLVYVAKWAKPVTLTLVKADASQKVFETVTDWQGNANKIYEGDTLESYEIGEVVEEYNNAASNGDKLQRGWYLDADGDEEYDAGEEYWLYGAGKGITLEESLTLRAWLVDPVVIKYQVSGEEKKAITRYYRPGESCWLASSMGELFGQDGYEEDRRVIQYWMDTDSKRYETDSRFMAEKDMTFTAYVLENEAPTVYLTKTGNYIIDGSYSRENFSANIQNATHWSWEYSSDLTNWTSIGYGTVEDSKGFSIRAGSGSSSTHLHYMDGAGRLYYRVIAWNAGETAISSITDLTDSMPHAYSDSVSITVVDSTYNLYTYTANFKFEDGTEMDGGSSVGKPKCVMKNTDIEIQAVCSCSGNYYATIKEDGYTWYESDDGVTWTVMSGKTTDTITVNEATANVKYYRYSATAEWNENEYAIGSEALKVYFSTPVEITAQPTIAEKLYSGDKATLSITASNTMSYQWQKKVGNGSWQDISGAILPSYTYTAPETDSAMSVSFRCGVESVATSETIYSNKAETTVMPKPTTGDLTLSLGEISGTNVPEEVSVKLKITLKKGEEAIPDDTYGAAVFAGGVGYVTLSRSGESEIALLDAENTASDTAVITGIPMNTSYTVVSTNPSYTVTSGASGTIASTAAAVTLNFKYQKASNDAMVKDDEIQDAESEDRKIEVTGKLLDNDTINEPKIYSVELVWGDMAFEYKEHTTVSKEWHPETHEEEETGRTYTYEWQLKNADTKLAMPKDMNGVVENADQSYVIVFNHSNAKVNVQIENTSAGVKITDKDTEYAVTSTLTAVGGTDASYAEADGKQSATIARGAEDTEGDGSTIYAADNGVIAKVVVAGGETETEVNEQRTLTGATAETGVTLASLKVTISKAE